jgi:hypothetical protein
MLGEMWMWLCASSGGGHTLKKVHQKYTAAPARPTNTSKL